MCYILDREVEAEKEGWGANGWILVPSPHSMNGTHNFLYSFIC